MINLLHSLAEFNSKIYCKNRIIMEQYSITISDTGDSLAANLQEFILWMQYQGWSISTIETYSNNIQQFIDFLKNESETQSVDDINTNNLFKYQHFVHNRRLKSGKSITISSIHT